MHCPRCGTPNWNEDRKAPRTIGELRTYCKKHRIDTEYLHFHIDEDFREAQAYGIYQDEEGLYTVYKNHSDGTREISYCGKNEEQAVKALYAKLCRAVFSRGTQAVSAKNETFDENELRVRKRDLTQKLLSIFITVLVLAVVLFALSNAMREDSYLEENEVPIEVMVYD